MSKKYQQYSFQSVWRIPHHRETVWSVMTKTPFSWEQWWPQLTNVHDVRTTHSLSGTTFACIWQAPLGYKLHCRITIKDLVPASQVTLTVTGDLQGVVRCRLHDEAHHTRVDVDWQVATTKRWMNRLSPLLRPVFKQGHHAVMRSGEKGLRRHIQKPG